MNGWTLQIIRAGERSINKRGGKKRGRFFHEVVLDCISRYQEENIQEGRSLFGPPSE